MLNVESASHFNMACLRSNDDLSWLWHRRITHILMDQLNKLVYKELVKGLPKLKFQKDGLCNACQKGKQIEYLSNLKMQFLPRECLNFYVKIFLVLLEP